MLIQFAFLVFGLMGLLAAVADLGTATVTRVQAQNAADAAVVEGLRFRNVGRNLFDESADPFVSDCMRRAAARAAAPLPFEAGTWRPELATNQGANVGYGDIVSGSFVYTSSSVLIEGDDYQRSDPGGAPDFTPAGAVGPGASGLAGCPADDPMTGLPDFTGVPASGGSAVQDEALLVRVRRATSPRPVRNSPLDEDTGVSTSGPTLPLVFGQAAMLPWIDAASADYAPRLDGLTVRGTAIARVVPARRIGVRHPRIPEFGAMSLALRTDCWNSPSWGTPVDPLDPEEVWATVVVQPGVEGDTWTIQTSACAVAGVVVPERAWSAGEAATPALWVAGAVTALDESGYVPIFHPIADPLGTPVERVVAFGRATACVAFAVGQPCDPAATLPAGVLRLRRRNVASNLPRVAPHNASAHLPDGFPAVLTPGEVRAVLAQARLVRAPLLAPVLAR